MTIASSNTQDGHLDAIFNQKRALRTQVRKTLKAIHPSLRSQQGGKKLYVPRVEDKNSHMRMLRISRIDDLIANSMDILEPALIDAYENAREDVMRENEPVDLFLLPGLTFDKSERRLGRGGGYFDTFLKNYKDLAKTRNWIQPLLVALSYSEQILDEGVIPMTSSDVPIDALVSPAGVIPITTTAINRMGP